MTKKEFIDKVAKRSGLSKKDATSAVNAVFEILEESLAEGDKLIIPGFGSFFVGRRAERKGRNPQTGQEIIIPAKKVPKFRASSNLRAKINAVK